MMNEQVFSNIGERQFSTQLPNGLYVRVIVKPGFRSSFALFATDYGGADRVFDVDGKERYDTATIAMREATEEDLAAFPSVD